MPNAVLPIPFSSPFAVMRPDAESKKFVCGLRPKAQPTTSRFDAAVRGLIRIIHSKISIPKGLFDDPVLLEQMLRESKSDKRKIVCLEVKTAVLRQRSLGQKSEQTSNAATPQLTLSNEADRRRQPVTARLDHL